jgi:DNA-binding MarR family transcriptional regulator
MRRRNTILAALELFRSEDLPRSLSSFLLFLYVCENEGLTVSELAHVTHTSVAMTARVVKMLAGDTTETPLAPERSIFVLKDSPLDKRLKLVHLSAHGRILRNRFESLIAEASPIRDQATFAVDSV